MGLIFPVWCFLSGKGLSMFFPLRPFGDLRLALGPSLWGRSWVTGEKELMTEVMARVPDSPPDPLLTARDFSWLKGSARASFKCLKG